MPFDGADYVSPPHDPPGRATRNKNTLTVAMLALASGLFLVPILIATLIDVVRFVQGH